MADIPNFEDFKKQQPGAGGGVGAGAVPSFEDFKAEQSAPAATPPNPNVDTTATANLPPHSPGLHNFLYSPNGFIRSGARQAGNGIQDLVKPGNRMRGASDVIEGLGSMAAPAAIPMALAAPLPTLGAAIGGYGGAKAAGTMMPSGSSPEATRLAENVGSIPGSMLGAGAAAGVGRTIASPMMRSAMKLPSNESAAEVLNRTSGVRPEAIAASARNEIGAAIGRRNAMIGQASEMPSLAPSRNDLMASSDRMIAGNKEPKELAPMFDRLHMPVPGFPGRVNPTTGELAERQNPMDFLGIRGRFGDDFTKFDYSRPLSDPARKAGNSAYLKMTDELHRVAPGSAAEDRIIHNLIPAKEQGDLIAKQPGPIDRGIQRMTAKTGAMALPALGYATGGAPGAAAAVTMQEMLNDPTIRAALARRAHASFPVKLAPAAGLTALSATREDK